MFETANPSESLRPAFDLTADFGTVQLYRRAPKISPMQMFGAVLRKAMDDANSYRKTVAPRRAEGDGGYHENFTGGQPWASNVRVTAFAETRERCQQVIDGYLRIYPVERHDTRFGEIRCIDGEMVARGSRNEERKFS